MKTLSILVDEQTDIFRLSKKYYRYVEIGEPEPVPTEEVARLYFEKRLRVPESFSEIRAIFSVFL